MHVIIYTISYTYTILIKFLKLYLKFIEMLLVYIYNLIYQIILLK